MKKICVHSGSFHADDALTVYFLLNTNEFSNSEIIRTRDEEIINLCDVVADVGGIYDHSRRRYDHHQESMVSTFPGFSVPLASCGLVYLHYGKEIIVNLSKKLNLSFDEQYMDFIYNYIYGKFIQEIDAKDNGFSECAENAKPAYAIGTDISSRIGRMNPHWRIENPNFDEEFKKAVEYIGKEFEFFFSYALKFSIHQYQVVKEAFDHRLEADPNGQFFILSSSVPIMDYLPLLEGDEKKLLYALYERKNHTWAVKAITTSHSFQQRKPLPFPGVNREEMKQLAGIDGLVFAHTAPFLAVFETKDEAIEYARFAANYTPPKEE